ncbi:MAG: metal-dependent hydrolase [Magnetococcales bacterium]|nr:metal-dependent hydrolase [Magnetococcales bacterium]
MDPLTHALLGGSAAAAVSAPSRMRAAAVIGGFAALLADLDILIQSDHDPLLQLEFHRQFTHALIFIPIGALVASLLLRWWTKPQGIPFRSSWGMACLGYGTAGPLDACTSYGTQLLWPFSELRIAWSVIPVVEPITTLILMIFLYRAAKRHQPGWAMIGLTLMLAWFGVATFQHHRASELARSWAQKQGDPVESLHVKPTMMNLILWRAVYKTGPEIQALAVRPALSGDERLYPGERAVWIDTSRALPDLPSDSVLAEDLRRFSRLSDHFVVAHPERPDWFGDGRYALLPDRIAPLWGITIDARHSDRHAPFDNFRAWKPDTMPRFLHMLSGKPAPTDSGSS